jgi:hypothetical protein
VKALQGSGVGCATLRAPPTTRRHACMLLLPSPHFAPPTPTFCTCTSKLGAPQGSYCCCLPFCCVSDPSCCSCSKLWANLCRQLCLACRGWLVCACAPALLRLVKCVGAASGLYAVVRTLEKTCEQTQRLVLIGSTQHSTLLGGQGGFRDSLAVQRAVGCPMLLAMPVALSTTTGHCRSELARARRVALLACCVG